MRESHFSDGVARKVMDGFFSILLVASNGHVSANVRVARGDAWGNGPNPKVSRRGRNSAATGRWGPGSPYPIAEDRCRQVF